ncbi:MAG: glycoside hydrolase family 130 protein [Armatimonadota bacterium]
MQVMRFPENPVITPAMVPPSRPDFEVVCAFNAGVAQCNGETILLLRIAECAIGDASTVRVPVLNCDGDAPFLDVLEFDRHDPTLDFHDPRLIFYPGGMYLTTISHLRVARSRDGRHFTIDPQPALFPDRASEQWGLEDPRVTEIDGVYYIAYKGVSPDGVTTSLAVTRDFVHVEKKGIIFCPENLDVCIFPEQVGGRYVALHRPVPRSLGAPNMWVAYSSDLLQWGDHHFLMGVRPGKWDCGRVGGGAIPIKTEQGWLEIYHGAGDDNVYCLGAVLLDLDEPHKIIARGEMPIMVPQAPYETHGFFSNVIFTCGAVTEGDRLLLYYGATDWVMAGAELSISEILASLVPSMERLALR